MYEINFQTTGLLLLQWPSQEAIIDTELCSMSQKYLNLKRENEAEEICKTSAQTRVFHETQHQLFYSDIS